MTLGTGSIYLRPITVTVLATLCHYRLTFIFHPQASQERDQQKLAHLMRVGKLGGRISALRGKSVPAASGKRR